MTPAEREAILKTLHEKACRGCVLLAWRDRCVPYCAGGHDSLISADAQVPAGIALCQTYAPAPPARSAKEAYESVSWDDAWLDCGEG